MRIVHAFRTRLITRAAPRELMIAAELVDGRVAREVTAPRIAVAVVVLRVGFFVFGAHAVTIVNAVSGRWELPVGYLRA
jgi:hypothetical protein